MSAEDGSMQRRSVAPDEEGCRLDVFLARQPEVGSRVLAKSLVQRGHVLVNDQPGKPGLALTAGATVAFRVVAEPVDPLAEEQQFELRLLHEDAVVAVIDKPAGLAVHPAGTGPRAAAGVYVTSLAQRRWGSLPTLAGGDRPGIVHRLDKDTSGVMLIARNDEAFRFLQSQFKARTVKKEYRALCFGDPRFDSDHIEANLATDPGRGDRMMVVKEGGREASTYYEVIERFGDVTYVRCLPRTGRTHQIRVHMASIGHPLVSDRAYRARRSDRLPEGAPDPGRHCLHAWSLAFQHPRTHEAMLVDAELPEDFGRLLRWLQERGRG